MIAISTIQKHRRGDRWSPPPDGNHHVFYQWDNLFILCSTLYLRSTQCQNSSRNFKIFAIFVQNLAFLEWKYLADVSNVIFGHIRVLEVDFLLSERIQDWSKWFEMIQNDIFFRKSNLAKFPEMSSIPTWCFSNRSRDSKLWVDDDVITWPKSGSNVACYTTDESSWWRHVIIIRIDRK